MSVVTFKIADQLIEEGGFDVVIPDGYTSIVDEAFYNYGLLSIAIPESLTTIGNAAFSYNRLTNIDIPNGVISIGDYAFYGNPLENLDIGINVEEIGLGAFYGNNLTKVEIPDSVVSIGGDSFTSVENAEQGGITTLSLGSNVESIGDYAFNFNQIKELYIPNIQHINDIEKIQLNNPATFYLEKSIVLGSSDVNSGLVGTKKKDKITGTSQGEVLAGMNGKDVLKGGAGADGFLFNQPGGFGNKHEDKIKDFDSDEGDSILLDQGSFALGKKVKIKSYRVKNKVKKAEKSKNDFVYDEKNGLLYFNENGKQEGWGDGGLFVKLQGTPELGADNFTIV